MTDETARAEGREPEAARAALAGVATKGAPARGPAAVVPEDDEKPRQLAILVTCTLFIALFLLALPSGPRLVIPRPKVDAPPLRLFPPPVPDRPLVERQSPPPAPRRVFLPDPPAEDVAPLSEPTLAPPAPPAKPAPVFLGLPQAPPSRDRSPVREGMTGLVNPRVIDDVQPDYPTIARRLRAEGEVVMQALVDRQGRVASVELLRSSELAELDRAAMEAVRRRRYEPGRLEGRPVDVLMTIRVRFHLGS